MNLEQLMIFLEKKSSLKEKYNYTNLIQQYTTQMKDTLIFVYIFCTGIRINDKCEQKYEDW